MGTILNDMPKKLQKTDEEWKKLLSNEEYLITREKATEPPFAGKYWNTKEKGIYKCVCCGTDLFSSETKFDSGTGWPSFFEPLVKENIECEKDYSHGMERVEVLCSNCNAHLGHLFNDGPKPAGLRYCINSAALKLEKK